MKTKVSILVYSAAMFLSIQIIAQDYLNNVERDYAVKYLSNSMEDLFKAVEGLTEDQLNYKPAQDSWSIAECVEHIAISESALFGSLKEALTATNNENSEVKLTDDQIIQIITDRSAKVKTIPQFEPSNKFSSYQGSLDEFKKLREKHISFLENTKDDLRNHYYGFPFGTADTYQLLLFMAGHSVRHTMQINEILANPTFP